MLFFQLINARHERASMVLTSNKGFDEWGQVLGHEVMAAALIERLLHHCHLVNIRGNSHRMCAIRTCGEPPGHRPSRKPLPREPVIVTRPGWNGDVLGRGSGRSAPLAHHPRTRSRRRNALRPAHDGHLPRVRNFPVAKNAQFSIAIGISLSSPTERYGWAVSHQIVQFRSDEKVTGVSDKLLMSKTKQQRRPPR